MKIDSFIDGNLAGTAILQLKARGITPDALDVGSTPDFCIWTAGDRWGHVSRRTDEYLKHHVRVTEFDGTAHRTLGLPVYFVSGSKNPESNRIRMSWDETVEADNIEEYFKGSARQLSKFKIFGNVKYFGFGEYRPMPKYYLNKNFIESGLD